MKTTRLGLHISDTSVRYVVLEKSAAGFSLATFGEVPVVAGDASNNGADKNTDSLTAALKLVHKQSGHSRAYVATALSEAEHEDTQDTAEKCAAAGIKALSVEHDADAIARAVLRVGESATRLVVDADEAGDQPAHLVRTIDRYLIRRHSETGPNGERLPDIEAIVLVGTHTDLTHLAERLSGSLRLPVIVGDVWTNLSRPPHGVSSLQRRDSLAYAAAIGAALCT